MSKDVEEFRVVIRIEAKVTLRETGDPRGLAARYEVQPEAMIEPTTTPQASEFLAIAVTEKALNAMKTKGVQYTLQSDAAPPVSLREHFGEKGRAGK